MFFRRKHQNYYRKEFLFSIKGSSLFFLIFFYIIYFQNHFLVSNSIYFYIIFETTGYYQYPTSFEFLTNDIQLKYFDPENAKNCLLCNFTSEEKSNSTKRDIIIACAANDIMNIALLQRTLRTTKSNASLVLFLDSNALNTKLILKLKNFSRIVQHKLLLLQNYLIVAGDVKISL